MSTGELSRSGASSPRFVDVLRIRVFAVLYTAETQSIIGDQLARVALSVLVYEWTKSPAATAAMYAFTFLPAILGGVVLARIGDRAPRRAVMVGCDVLRAVLFTIMAVPGMPLVAIFVLLVAAVFVGPAFAAAEVSYLADALNPEDFRAATGLRMINAQLAQVGGFAIGGVVVAVLSPQRALMIDAATYLASAIVIRTLLARDVRRGGTVSNRPSEHPTRPIRQLWGDPQLRGLTALSALAGFFIVPEGLAIPLANHTDESTVLAGMLLASIPLGGALGAAVLVRVRAGQRRARVACAMAIGCGLPLAVTALEPGWPIVLICWCLSGALAAYQVEIVSAIVPVIPDAQRSQVMGIVGASLVGAQGFGVLAFGIAANFAGIAASIAIAGASGSLLAAGCVAGPLRTWMVGPQPVREVATTAVHRGLVHRGETNEVSDPLPASAAEITQLRRRRPSPHKLIKHPLAESDRPVV